jgi:hypothetical protein
MYERSSHLLNCHLAGFTYYDGLDVIEDLKLGTKLRLIAEPENPHDADAVAIYYKDTKLGFIPRTHNSIISNLLYFGHSDILEARIASHKPDVDSENQFRINIKLKDNRKG